MIISVLVIIYLLYCIIYIILENDTAMGELRCISHSIAERFSESYACALPITGSVSFGNI